jgi:hypothetical protein
MILSLRLWRKYTMQLSEKDIARFWKKVKICEHGRECRACHWFWKGHTRGTKKYGSFTVFYDGDEKRWQYYSHRVIWYVLTGEDSLPAKKDLGIRSRKNEDNTWSWLREDLKVIPCPPGIHEPLETLDTLDKLDNLHNIQGVAQNDIARAMLTTPIPPSVQYGD